MQRSCSRVMHDSGSPLFGDAELLHIHPDIAQLCVTRYLPPAVSYTHLRAHET